MCPGQMQAATAVSRGNLVVEGCGSASISRRACREVCVGCERGHYLRLPKDVAAVEACCWRSTDPRKTRARIVSLFMGQQEECFEGLAECV